MKSKKNLMFRKNHLMTPEQKKIKELEAKLILLMDSNDEGKTIQS